MIHFVRLPLRRVLAALSITLAVGSAAPAAAQQAPVAPPAPASVQGAAGPRGFIVGQVLDRESGRPLESANIVVLTTNARAQSDLDGRFRIPAPVGVHAIRVFRLGNTPAQVDSVRVQANASTTVNVVLATAALNLGAVAVTAGPVRASSEDALLAMQKNAPRVSDGISAEAIRRAPGADASDAIARVTGVSVVDNKFAVVRGLAERYSNTLLNGVELPSPEPLKKIVPLDLFPSSLLESIVVTKTATPDRPGDFAGGSVEVTTKEFPDDPVAELSLSSGYGSQATFRQVTQLPQRGADWFGFDAGGQRKLPTAVPRADATPEQQERFAEALRNVWTPPPTTALPDLGAGLNLGGRFGGDAAPYGYAAAVTYSRQTDATPNRLSQIVFSGETGVPDQGYVSDETTNTVDVGMILNLAARPRPTQKLGWKNLYTRNTEEMLARRSGYTTAGSLAERVTHQARYITRTLAQTQLTGDHLIRPLFDSRFEWRATAAVSARDEPENRSLLYFRNPEGVLELDTGAPSQVWFRFLDDRVRSVQADWSAPITRLFRDGAQIKSGALYRERDRAFEAFYLRYYFPTDAAGSPIRSLSPEAALSPENLGQRIELRNEGTRALPYESDDDVAAAYAMLDLPLTGWLRLVGGLRREEWRLRLFQGSREEPIGAPTYKRTSDDLFSANATISLGDRQNLRLAAYQTVARPDAREVSADYYVAISGDCANQGNPELVRTRIGNADIRWEFYPRAGELISVSGFVKDFKDPIAELLTYPGSSECTVVPFNLESARITGAELEARRLLDFLPGELSKIAIGLNLTLVRSTSRRQVPGSDLFLDYQLQGQSDVIGNLNLLYADPERRIDGTLLLNYFSDRIVRYGIASIVPGTGIDQVPNVMERGRFSLDAKLRRPIGRGATISLSGRNLLDSEVILYQDSEQGRTRTGYFRPGISFSLGLGYALR